MFQWTGSILLPQQSVFGIIEFGRLSGGALWLQRSIKSAEKEYPLLEYAAHRWHTHFEYADDTGEFIEDGTLLYLIGKLIRPQSSNY